MSWWSAGQLGLFPQQRDGQGPPDAGSALLWGHSHPPSPDLRASQSMPFLRPYCQRLTGKVGAAEASGGLGSESVLDHSHLPAIGQSKPHCHTLSDKGWVSSTVRLWQGCG